jgi:alginate O-acetyltransferase complex protein AlgI
MLFNTTYFACFFVVFCSIYYFAPFRQSQRVWFLFLAGLAFYATFSLSFLPYLLGTGLFDYYVADAIARTDEENERRRKLLLVSSLVVNLSVLAYFKYMNFFLGAVTEAANGLGAHVAPRTLHILLPVGISFYTFQSMSYVLDVYRGAFTPKKRLHEFLASLTFFPHLVAGPIVRASSFLPQLRSPPRVTLDDAVRGGLMIGAGLVKKTVADLVAPTADVIFRTGGAQSPLAVWTGVLAFTAQIYGDFSGYTDIAIGASLLLGFKLPQNFNLPYFAISPIDYWARWHMSLSAWLRDYLYMPLAVRLRRQPYLALLFTWLLGGLWHGANWTFVAWGAYHGVLLIATHQLQKFFPRLAHAEMPWPTRVLRVLVTFYFILVGNVLFRAPDIHTAGVLLSSMHARSVASRFTYASCLALGFAVAALVFCHLFDVYTARVAKLRNRVPVFCVTAIACVWFVIVFGRADRSFIYFQF